MAEKRMFAQKIIDSDAFLDMPLSAQALYFHLNMRADDDGFVGNPRRITKYVSASDDDLKILLMKRFIIGFESGVIVIKHWRMHNTLRQDRYRPTDYQEELARLTVKDNRAYTDIPVESLPDCEETAGNSRQPNGNPTATKWQPTVSTDIGLGLDIGLDIGLDNNISRACAREDACDTDERFTRFWAAYPRKVGKGAALKAWKKIRPSEDLTEKILKAIDAQKRTKQWNTENGRFVPNPVTWLNQSRWLDEATGEQFGGTSLDVESYERATAFLPDMEGDV